MEMDMLATMFAADIFDIDDVVCDYKAKKGESAVHTKLVQILSAISGNDFEFAKKLADEIYKDVRENQ